MARGYTWQDMMTPEIVADPYPFYDAMRQHSPTGLAPEGTPPGATDLFWPILKYGDVYAALSDHETFSSEQQVGGAGAFRLVLINDDPPRHTRLRKLVSRTFIPKRIAAWEPWIRQTSNDLFDEMGDGAVESVWNYTVPLPVKAIATLLGIPTSEYQTFKRWTDSLLSGTGGEDRGRMMQDMMEMAAYFARTATARRADPQEDLISLLVTGDTDEGKLDDGEVIGFCILLLVAGNETTTNLMGNCLNFLANNPAVYAQLRADRDLVEPFIEEMLRYESPVQVLFRSTLKEAQLPSGAIIPAGQRCGMFYGSANRDPEAWAEADTFRVDRNLKDHVAFGHGIHYCLGSPLARTEARVTLHNLLERYREVRPGSGAAERQVASPIVFGFRTLPLELIP